MDAFDDPNLYWDITVPVGCDLNFAFQLEPWDATGALAASFIVTPTGGSPQTFAMTVSVPSGAATIDAVSQFSIDLSPSQMAGLSLNVSGNTAGYVIRWTDSGGRVWALGYGTVIAQ